MALDLRVRIAFTTHPRSGSPAWTDISQYVDVGSDSVDITRGMGDLDSTMNPSTLSLTLDNHDGRFTPGNASSPYYPNMILGKRIQVHGTTNGSTYHQRFDGFLDTISNGWAPSAKYGEVRITAVDLLKKLDRQAFTWDVIAQTMGPPGPLSGMVDYWPLSDAEGTTVPQNYGTLQSGNVAVSQLRQVSGPTAGSGVTFGSATGPGTDGLTAADSLNSMFVVDGPQPLSPEMTMMGFFRVVTLDGTFGISNLFEWNEAAGGGGACWVDNTGLLKALLFNSVPTTITLTGPNVNDGHTHHVAVTISMSGGTATMILWLDGANVASNTLGLFSASPTWIPTVWMQTFPLQVTSTAELVGAHLMTDNAPLSSVLISDIADAGLTGLTGETSNARFGRISGYIDSISVFPGSTSGTVDMGPLTGLKGKSFLQAIQEVADVEGGMFFMDVAGALRWFSRVDLYNQAAAWTLSNGQYTVDLNFLSDDSRLLNDVTVTDANGLVQEVINASSVTDNGTYSLQQNLNTADSNEALGWASWQVQVVSTVAPRAGQVTVELLQQQSLLTTAWNLELGNRVDLTGLPSTAPASSVTLQVVGYTESYSLSKYTMTLATRPYLSGSIFIFDDATYGKFDGPGVFSY